MNIQKIYDALEQDEQNSALGIITAELENQGYQVKIDGTPVDSNGLFEGNFSQLENKTEPVQVALFINGTLEQQMAIEFIDFHDFIIKRVAK